MRCRFLVAGFVLLMMLTTALAVPATGQTRDDAPEGWTAPRTPWGDPDLQGQWEQPDVDPAGAPPRRTPGRDRQPVAGRGAGHRGGQPRRLRPAAPGGQRRQLQRVLAGRRHRADANLADRRSAGRQDSPTLRRGGGPHRRRARGAEPARARHFPRHLQRPEPVDPLHLARLERHRELVQQQLPDLPGAGLRRRLPGADPRAADHPARRPPARPGVDPAVAGRFARPLGGRHAGRRDHQLHAEDQLPRLARHPAPDRALHARRRRHHRLPVHDRRSADVPAAVDRGAAHEPHHRPRVDLRVRLPRGELRDGGHPGRRAGRGTGALRLHAGGSPTSGSSRIA